MFLSELLPLAKALEIINQLKFSLKTEKIELESAYQRVLAEDIEALINSPSFDRSAMDGYAIKAEDSFGVSPETPAHLNIIDRIGAGQKSKLKLKKGEAIKIATGAPLPTGANGVVMEEYTYEQEDHLEVLSSITPGENVSRIGEDFKVGDLLLSKLQQLRPQDVGIISSAGHSQIKVFKKPYIGVITTGNELVKFKHEIKGSQVINSNYLTLKSLIESTNAIPVLKHCPDDIEQVKKEINNFLKDCDAVITTGGTAISKGDVVVDAVEELGEILFHGVSIRPGKPIACGLINQKPVFMLSGFPVAAMVQFDVLVRSYLLKMQQLEYSPKIVKRIASKKIPSQLGRTDYIRALTGDKEVKPILSKGSGVIRSMVQSNSYIIIEEDVEGIAAGEECDVLLFDSFISY